MERCSVRRHLVSVAGIKHTPQLVARPWGEGSRRVGLAGVQNGTDCGASSGHCTGTSHPRLGYLSRTESGSEGWSSLPRPPQHCCQSRDAEAVPASIRGQVGEEETRSLRTTEYSPAMKERHVTTRCVQSEARPRAVLPRPPTREAPGVVQLNGAETAAAEPCEGPPVTGREASVVQDE